MHEGTWFKSSRSGGADEKCVEVRYRGASVDIQDSKDPSGPCLTVSQETWQAFLLRVMQHRSTAIVDNDVTDKIPARAELDIAGAEWFGVPNLLEFAFVQHESTTFSVVRERDKRLVFTLAEWNAFVGGIYVGDFERSPVEA